VFDIISSVIAMLEDGSDDIFALLVSVYFIDYLLRLGYRVVTLTIASRPRQAHASNLNQQQM
jgi:hypothetical protein